MKASEVKQDGYYWYWDVSGWAIGEVYGGYLHYGDHSGKALKALGDEILIGPIAPPMGTPEQMAQWAADRIERQKWGIPE